MDTKCKILVATHKQCWLPNDPIYIGVQCGSSLNSLISYMKNDNSGKNISIKNPWYCELTALYWAWKNLNIEYIGLVHYRRYFSDSKIHIFKKNKINSILNSYQVEKILNSYNIILPYPRHYYIETRWNQFVNAHGSAALNVTKKIIKVHSSVYLSSYEKIMRRRWGHIFNMCIMRRDIMDAYCSWLFPLLFAVERKLKEEESYSPRIMGFLGERLLDVWIEAHKQSYVEIPVVNMDFVNWPAKVGSFLMRTIKGRRALS